MKKYWQQSFWIILVFTFACHDYMEVGPIGPRGPVGPQGPAGISAESGFVFEYSDIHFVGPDYEVFLPFPDDFETLESDVALVYLLWGTEEIDGELIEIWRPLPQQVFFSDGLLQYNFDFARYDVRLFLEATFPLDELTAFDTDDWIARLVIVPGDFWESGRVDFDDYNQVQEALQIRETAVRKGVINRR